METPVVALVLAGGTGTRLYPATRSDRPKQFLSLGGDRPLLERTVDRAGFADETYVLTAEKFADGVRERVPQAGVLVEPAPEDTGPALVYAVHRIREQVGECTTVCLPSDHLIEGDFAGTCRQAAAVAADTGRLVTVGVEPTRPATGYGYVEPAEQRDGYTTVAAFHEKPDAGTAAAYLEAGHYWNAGIFAWDAGTFLAAARETPLAPLLDALDRGAPAEGFAAVEPTSVDRAVLERADNLAVVPAAFEWDDLGTWDAVARHLPTDEEGNAIIGEGLRVDAADNVVATDGHVSLLGVENLVVVKYGDRALVCPRGETERVREVVARLRERDWF
jgi:mannose-1-phosphate guanylyltransferase